MGAGPGLFTATDGGLGAYICDANCGGYCRSTLA